MSLMIKMHSYESGLIGVNLNAEFQCSVSLWVCSVVLPKYGKKLVCQYCVYPLFIETGQHLSNELNNSYSHKRGPILGIIVPAISGCVIQC